MIATPTRSRRMAGLQEGTPAMPDTSSKSPALTIEHWPVEKPIPHARNVRLCPQAAIDKVAASIREFGWRQPIVVDEQGVILAGHTRLLAAKQLGLKVVPVHVAAGLTPAQAKAYRLMDNRSNEETSWDLSLLPQELEDLLAMEIDPALTGFAPEEIAALLATPTQGLTDPDEVPETPETPVSKLGDLYRLGSHRLLCGDSTKTDEVRRLMDGERAILMATDPPYLCSYDGGNRPKTWAKDGRRISSEEKTRHWDDYIDHDTSVGFYAAFLRAALDCALTEAPTIYQWFGMTRADIVMEAWRSNGLLPHQVVVWRKSRPVLGRSWFLYDYEPCMVGWVKGKMPKAHPPNDARAVWDVDQREGIEESAGHEHPTMKPVELLRRPISWHTTRGGLLYEPFAGSGTAIIAAEMTGRRCFALELSPAFCDVAVTRWERFTGRNAVREASSVREAAAGSADV